MAPKHTKPAVNIASKRLCQVIDLEIKLKVIKDYKGGKSVKGIAHQSGMSHSTIATVFKNKNKVMEGIKGSASLKAMRLTKILEGHILEMEKLLIYWIEAYLETDKIRPITT